METLREFTNRPGMTFDPDKTFILYAEDLLQMKENFNLLFNQSNRFFASQVVTYVSGRHYSTDLSASPSEPLSYAADDFVAVPFLCSQNFNLNRLGVSIYDAGGDGGLKIGVYDSGENGLPANLLFSSGDIDADSSGFVFADPHIDLIAGKIYWFAVRTQNIISLYSSPLSTALNYGLSSPENYYFNSCLSTSLTYSADWPESVPFTVENFFVPYNPVSFRFRVD